MKEVQQAPAYPIALFALDRPPRNDAERIVKGVVYENRLDEVQKKLSSGNWIAIDARSENETVEFTLGWV